MKNLIGLLIVVLIVTMANESFAQSFSVKAGLNLSNMLSKVEDETVNLNYKMNPGFNLGATVEFPINEMFSFETGLMLSTKGRKFSGEVTIIRESKIEGKTNLFYLDIPLSGKASLDLGGAKVYGLFGPYLGIGLSGIFKGEQTFMDRTDKWREDIEWGSDLKRLDFGLTVGAGVEFNSIQIGFSYGLGLANISPYSDYGYKINNRVLGLSIGHQFGGE